MTHDQEARAWPSGANRATTARQMVRVGNWTVPVTVVAWGVSAIFHGGLLTASYFVTRSPATVTDPDVSFARGDQATRIQVLLVPWPDPVQEEEAKRDPQEDTSDTESSATSAKAEEVIVAPLPEESAPDSRLDPPVTASEDQPLLEEKAPKETETAELPLIEEVRTDPPADDALETVPSPQPIADIFENLLDRLEQSLAPPVAERAEDPVTPPTEEPVRSKASSAQPAGVETGVETLDLPTPKYPSFSRRRGEQGLVLLQVEVLPDGSVGDIKVLRDAGFVRLTKAAIAAARKGRFKPATRDGHPIRATVRIPFRFVLR